jgi:hypothetical protein
MHLSVNFHIISIICNVVSSSCVYRKRDYMFRHLPGFFFAVLGIKLRALRMLDKHSTTELNPQSSLCFKITYPWWDTTIHLIIGKINQFYFSVMPLPTLCYIIRTQTCLFLSFFFFFFWPSTLLQYALVITWQRSWKTYVHRKTCIWMFIASLFLIAKTWKQLRYPSVGEWINKMWYLQTMEYIEH